GVIFWPLAVISALLIIAVAILYFPYFWVHGGQTPGMTLMKIKVVRDDDGGPITWGPAILRWIGFWVSTAVFYIGFIWIFIDKRRRGWMDLLAAPSSSPRRNRRTRPERAGLSARADFCRRRDILPA